MAAADELLSRMRQASYRAHRELGLIARLGFHRDEVRMRSVLQQLAFTVHEL